MKNTILLLCLLPVALHAVPCTDSTESPTTQPPTTTTTQAPTTTTTQAPSTEYVPPPKAFPNGTYALVRPDAGCPYSTGFGSSWRYWDTEDYYNANTLPDPEHFQGFMKRDGMQLYFCVKTNAAKGGAYEWPAGDYCIVKKDDCPTGFESGSIFWDDEDSSNQNKVYTKRQVNGTFNEDTQIGFCCKNDGSAAAPIKLPIRRAFYLMRYLGECQEVAEMSVTEEVVGWDDEDTSNNNANTGASPMDSGNAANHKLHFCYYQPLTPTVE